MKISYNWLQTYFEKELPNPKNLADLLNIRSLEVEEIEEKDGDSIFEIKVTPNRAPDCLSHIGIAKEIAIHTRQPIFVPKIINIEDDYNTEKKVEVEDQTCIRYMAREVKGVVIGESPLALKLKLESIGQRSINTVVDITNLVMYEIGQPMHAFDADKLSGQKIFVASPKDTKFTTLDNKEVELTSEDITIQDETDNLAIAGIKGGKKAEVDFNTKIIILEAANFFPVKVRKTSRRIGIQTDSSKRFENGLAPQLAQQAIHLASHYIKIYASDDNTQFSNIVDVYPRPANPYYTGVSLEEINRKLGITLEQKDVEDIFNRMSLSFEYINTKDFVTKEIEKLIGTPHNIYPSLTYDAPRSFDCTTLTAYVYSHGGKSIPRLTIDQLFFGKTISKDELEPGDLVFSKQEEGEIRYETVNFLPGLPFKDGVDHVGMYMGDDTIIHTSRYKGCVVKEKLSESDNFKTIVGYRRFVDNDEMRFAIRVPEERLDLRFEIDIVEEVGRIYGYENISPSPLKFAEKYQVTTYDKLATIKACLVDLGFDEVLTYTFTKKGDVSVIKPLAKDKSYLRTDLTKGLIDALDLNFRNKDLFATDTIQIFEIGHVFTETKEKTILGIAVRSGNKKNKTRTILEETIKNISKKLNIPLDISIRDQQEVIEIELDTLLDSIACINNTLNILEPVVYTPFSLYPFIVRDIAVWSNDSKTRLDIEKIITENGTELLYRYDLFDEFKKDNQTSYAYRLVFQSCDKTLTDEEVNPIMDRIYATLQSDSGFEIR